MSTLKGVKKPFLRRVSKRTLFVSIGVAFVLVLLAVTWFLAANAWQSLADNAERDEGNAKKTRQEALSGGNRGDRLAALAKLANDKYAPERCKGAWWYGWQQNVSEPAKAAKTRCESADRVLGALNEASTAVNRYLRDEKTIEAQLATLKIDSKQKDWQVAARDSADKALGSLKKLKVSDKTEPVQKEAVKRVESIVMAWKTLNEADKKQDKTAYMAAMTVLNDSYAGLSAISDVSDAQLAKLVGEVKNVT